jgi:hypothetical protein
MRPGQRAGVGRAECDVLGMPNRFIEFVSGSACEGGDEGTRKRRNIPERRKTKFGATTCDFSAQDNLPCR